jgi:hypothetical protein
MLARTLGDYGAPFVNRLPVEDPQGQLDADQYNRVAEDLAQLTRTAWRAVLSFPTDASSNPTVTRLRSVWGSGVSLYPSIVRTGAGVYTVTFATTFTDGLAASESTALDFAQATLGDSTTAGFARAAVTSANVLTVRTFNSSWAASDLGGSIPVFVFAL